MLSELFKDLFNTDPYAFARLPRGVVLEDSNAQYQISKIIQELSGYANHVPPLNGSNKESENFRFLFLVSRFDFKDIRYGHVPWLIVLASALLNQFHKSEVVFLVTGTVKAVNKPWDGPDNLHLEENWIDASNHGTTVYPFKAAFNESMRTRIKFITAQVDKLPDSLADSYSFAFRKVFDIKPTHVFCAGGIYYPAPAADILFPFFPVIRFPFKSTNHFSPQCDAMLELITLENPPVGPERRVQINLSGAVNPASAHGLTAQIALPRNAVIGLTAIVGSRLTKSLATAPDDWIEGIAATFDRYHDFYWLLVGEESAALRPDIDARLARFVRDGRILILPYVPGLDDYFEISSFMIQPYGQTGGGTALLLAHRRGIPVVCFSDHDMIDSIGAGRGSASIDGGLRDLERFLCDPAALRQAKTNLLSKTQAQSAESQEEFSKFGNLIEVASSNFQARLARNER